MNSRKPCLTLLSAGTLLFAGNLLAQTVPAPTVPAPTASSAAPTPAAPIAAPTLAAPIASPATATDTATYQSPQGKLIVHSAPAPAPRIGPAPSFEQLSGGSKTISEAQAVAYPPLANDFINADGNRNSGVSKAEYTQWIKQL